MNGGFFRSPLARRDSNVFPNRKERLDDIRQFGRSKIAVAVVPIVLSISIDISVVNEVILDSDAVGRRSILVGKSTVQSHLVSRIS